MNPSSAFCERDMAAREGIFIRGRRHDAGAERKIYVGGSLALQTHFFSIYCVFRVGRFFFLEVSHTPIISHMAIS